MSELVDDDLKMLYQNYRLGTLPWETEENLSPRDFLEIAHDFIPAHYQFGWAVRDPEKTVLVTFGVETRDFVLVGDVIWSPKTTNRQKLEAGIVFFDSLRSEMAILCFCRFENKNYFDRLMDYKLLRRIGTFYTFEGEKMAQYQTRVK